MAPNTGDTSVPGHCFRVSGWPITGSRFPGTVAIFPVKWHAGIAKDELHRSAKPASERTSFDRMTTQFWRASTQTMVLAVWPS